MAPETSCPRIALTAGEPAGIGPDIIINACQESLPAELVVIASHNLIKERARQLDQTVSIRPFSGNRTIAAHEPGVLNVLNIDTATECRAGHTDPRNAAYVLKTLETACRGCIDGIFAAMVTAPVHKGVINEAGFPFTGHTEYLASLCDEASPVMMLADKSLRVALATTHMPLSAVSALLDTERLEKVIRILRHDLQHRFSIAQPRILVCGLNPHAGEDGHLGREELDTIIPVLEKLRQEGLQLTGPVPADTAFTPERLREADVVLSMYHDQGLPVLKSRGFGEIVNITLGLPIIRTSVDHGTALDLAGTGRASSSSLVSAINTAVEMANAGH